VMRREGGRGGRGGGDKETGWSGAHVTMGRG
jgi:hypothetical protein